MRWRWRQGPNKEMAMKLNTRTPDFNNLLKVLRREAPDRPTLFEFFLNPRLFKTVTGKTADAEWGSLDRWRWAAAAYRCIGYDYVTVLASAFWFPKHAQDRQASLSLNEGAVITDRASFDAYSWPDPRKFPSYLDVLAGDLYPGMKLVVFGPSGVLENVVSLVGFDNAVHVARRRSALGAGFVRCGWFPAAALLPTPCRSPGGGGVRLQ